MSEYIRTTPLQKRQNRLFLNLVDYDLSGQWHSHDTINRLRKTVTSRMPKGLFDPQDLEHQVLFRLTTFAPEAITPQIIDDVIEEQARIINERLQSSSADLEYLFRGLSGKHKDLNIHDRLELKNIENRLIAVGNGRSFNVDFRRVADTNLITLFTENLHYIHSGRHRGDVFGLFFEGDEIPWGIETTEPSVIAKSYKKDALLAHGIDPNKAIEITRLYLLPGSPKNAISILDGLVGRLYKDQDMEAMYTTTMPTYAKTKGATTAGGMKDVLLVKELTHKFEPVVINGQNYYKLNVSAGKSDNSITTHPDFPTLFTVETFMRLQPNRDIKQLPILKNRVIYINSSARNGKQIKKETKFKVSDLTTYLEKIRQHGNFTGVSYMHDEFWVSDDKPRIRLRKTDTFAGQAVEVSLKYRLSKEKQIRTEVVESLYRGDSVQEAVRTIREQGDYEPKNSYEKVAASYSINSCEVSINIYPFGAYIELTGEETPLWKTIELLGLKKDEAIATNTDETYLEWNKKMGLKDLLHINFGLN